MKRRKKKRKANDKKRQWLFMPSNSQGHVRESFLTSACITICGDDDILLLALRIVDVNIMTSLFIVSLYHFL